MVTNFRSMTGIHRLLRRTGALLLILAFSFVSAGGAVPVHASPLIETKAKVRITIYFQFTLPPEPVCVGKKYPVIATTMADYDFIKKDGKTEHQDAKPHSAILVEASSSNTVVGTISPSRIYSGFDVDANPAEAAFTFEAKKAGSTNLKFTATKGKKKFTDTIPIKVVDCEYKVTMNATDIDSRGGVTIWTIGHLDTKIKGEGGEMEGSGSFDFDSGFVGPPCSISYSEFQNATTVTGQITEDDQLKLNFAYQPGQITSKVSCPDSGGSGSQTVDLTNTGIASATFPATGGTRMLRFTYAGSDMAPGTMIINVQPVSEQAGG